MNSLSPLLVVKHTTGSTNQDTDVRRVRAKKLTKQIMTKLITDEIFQLVYHAQEQLGCEGCDNNWASQWDDACMFFGMNPECHVRDFIPEYFEQAMQSVNTDRVLPIFQAAAALLGSGSFIGEEMDLNTELNSIVSDISHDWKIDQADIAISFYSIHFDNTTDLIQFTIDRMKWTWNNISNRLVWYS